MSLERVKEKLQGILENQEENLQNGKSILNFIRQDEDTNLKCSGLSVPSSGILEEIYSLLDSLESKTSTQRELNTKLFNIVYTPETSCTANN